MNRETFLRGTMETASLTLKSVVERIRQWIIDTFGLHYREGSQLEGGKQVEAMSRGILFDPQSQAMTNASEEETALPQKEPEESDKLAPTVSSEVEEKKSLSEMEDSATPKTRDITVEPEPLIRMPKKMHNMPSKEKAMAIFDDLDGNGNNTLSFSELGKTWKALFGDLEHKGSVMKAYKAADENQDGFVVRSEFEAFLRYTLYHNNYYNSFALNGRHVNVLSKENFAKVANALDVNDADKVFDLMDNNHSGGVSYVEFCTWMAKNTCQWVVNDN